MVKSFKTRKKGQEMRLTDWKIIGLYTAYAVLQTTLIESKLVNSDGYPKNFKKMSPRPSEEDRRAVELYEKIAKYIEKRITDKQYKFGEEKFGDFIDYMKDNEIEEGREVNMLLLALIVLRKFLENPDTLEERLFYQKAVILKDMVIGRVKNEAGLQVVQNSTRLADNLYRYAMDRPILNKELRDKNPFLAYVK